MSDPKETNEQVIDEKKRPGKRAKKTKKPSKEEALKQDVERLITELNESKDKYLRLFAEFDNHKKRTVKERIELMRSAARDIMEALLPILDDFDRAKKSADDEQSDEQFSEGVELVYNKLHSMLQTKGLKAMETDGGDFDPELHDAITEIPAPTKAMKGKIVDTIEKGYYLNDVIIRHAKVVIGR